MKNSIKYIWMTIVKTDPVDEQTIIQYEFDCTNHMQIKYIDTKHLSINSDED